jgi:hypothetical protein
MMAVDRKGPAKPNTVAMCPTVGCGTWLQYWDENEELTCPACRGKVVPKKCVRRLKGDSPDPNRPVSTRQSIVGDVARANGG